MKKHTLSVSLLAVFALLTISQPVFADRTATANGYIDTSKKIVPKQNNEYAPSNVQEANSQKAQATKKAKQKADKQQNALASSSDYDKVKQASDTLREVTSKDNPSASEIKAAQRAYQTVHDYVSNSANSSNYGASQDFQWFQESASIYEAHQSALEDTLQAQVEAQEVLKKAKTSSNPKDLAPLTSYIYTEDGFFSTKDLFPKVVNSLVQGVFFLVKMIYAFIMLILEKIFSSDAYSAMDSVISYSARFFNNFLSEYQYAIYVLGLAGAVLEFLRKKRFPTTAFKFLLIMFLAKFLYTPSAGSITVGDSQIQSPYNLSKIIKVADQFSEDLTRLGIQNFNELDPSHRGISTNLSEDNLSAVRDSIFTTLVYEPFLSLNFDISDPTKISEDTVAQLFATKGKPSDVEKFAKEDDVKDMELLSWSSISSKVATVIASFLMALIIGFALILFGLTTLVFKYLVMIMVIFLPALLLIAMLPGLEGIAQNAVKKVIEFTVLGGLGLFFIRAFLFMNSVIAAASESVSNVYFWKSFLQAFIWLMIWRLRGAFGNLFVRGTVSAKKVGQKLSQEANKLPLPSPSSFSNLKPSYFSSGNNSRRFARLAGNLAGGAATSLVVDGALQATNTNDNPYRRLSTLRRAAYNTAMTGVTKTGQKLAGIYDNVRFDPDDTKGRLLAQTKRQDMKQAFVDRKDAMKDLATLPRFYGLRNRVHELAGDSDAPSQIAYRERDKRILERKERKDARLNRRLTSPLEHGENELLSPLEPTNTTGSPKAQTLSRSEIPSTEVETVNPIEELTTIETPSVSRVQSVTSHDTSSMTDSLKPTKSSVRATKVTKPAKTHPQGAIEELLGESNNHPILSDKQMADSLFDERR